MNARRSITALLVACISFSVADEASAYYAAHLGRFLSRDPMAEQVDVGGNIQSTSLGRLIDRDVLPSSEYPIRPELDGELDDQLRNLYAYTGNNPLVRTDPSGLFFGWNYGKYCGWNRRGPGKPIDAVDEACEKHDQCQSTWWTANPVHVTCCSATFCKRLHTAYGGGCAASYPGDAKREKECKDAAFEASVVFCGGVFAIRPYPDDIEWSVWTY